MVKKKFMKLISLISRVFLAWTFFLKNLAQCVSPCRTLFFWQQKPRRVVQFGFGPSCIIMWAFFLVLLKLSIFFVKSNAQILSNSMAGVVNTSGMRYFNEGIGFINKVTISEVKNYALHENLICAFPLSHSGPET